MKLASVRIHNFRSIVDSTDVEVDQSVTVLIGKNEQGKTNFLKAIQSFNSDMEYTPSDLPNHKRADLESIGQDTIPIVTVRFLLDKKDKSKLKTVNGIESALIIKATKYYDNHFAFWLEDEKGNAEDIKYILPDISRQIALINQIANSLLEKLKAHSTRKPDFAPNLEKAEQFSEAVRKATFKDVSSTEDILKTYITSIKTLSAQDQPIIDDIASAASEFDNIREAIKAEFAKDQSSALKTSFPYFILHSTKSDQIPNEVNIIEFTKDPDGTSKGMANLCRTAGLSVQKVKELSETADTNQREVYEDHYRGTISGGLNEYWTQKEYSVHFRIEKEKLSVSISDGKYLQRVPPSDRSDGFQWYLSFYSTMLNDVGVSNEAIILLDNPGLELHLDGQRDIKRFLEEKVALESQVVYVTHSPAMLDPFNLGQVRAVELQANNLGTKISRVVLTGGVNSDLLEPVRSAIGMSLVSSLVFNEWNVLVEGSSDKPIVEGLFYQHYKEHRERVMINGSLSESKDAFLVNFYQRTGLPYAVMLDADSGGRELYNELITLGLPAERIIRLEKVFTEMKDDFATEDLLSEDFYHAAVKLAYPSQSLEEIPKGKGKRANLYEAAFKEKFKIGFNKKRVADKVKQLLSEGKEDKDTRDRLGTLSTALIQNFEKQTKEKKEVKGPQQ